MGGNKMRYCKLVGSNAKHGDPGVFGKVVLMMMHHEGQTAVEISGFAKDIVWLLIPSLLMFIVMPWLIESRSWDFYPALAAGLACTVSGYFLMIQMMDRFGLST